MELSLLQQKQHADLIFQFECLSMMIHSCISNSLILVNFHSNWNCYHQISQKLTSTTYLVMWYFFLFYKFFICILMKKSFFSNFFVTFSDINSILLPVKVSYENDFSNNRKYMILFFSYLMTSYIIWLSKSSQCSRLYSFSSFLFQSTMS